MTEYARMPLNVELSNGEVVGAGLKFVHEFVRVAKLEHPELPGHALALNASAACGAGIVMNILNLDKMKEDEPAAQKAGIDQFVKDAAHVFSEQLRHMLEGALNGSEALATGLVNVKTGKVIEDGTGPSISPIITRH